MRQREMRQRGHADRRRLLLTAGVLAACAASSIVILDVPLALAVGRLPSELRDATGWFTGVIEVVFGFRLSIYVSGLALLAVSGLVALRRGLQPTAEVVAWLALCQLTTRFVVDILKPVFGRLRPHEAMTAGLLDGRFFSAVGNSFPSGHAAHFWGFYFALALLFPRWWIPLLVLPLLISAARVIATDHYVSDVIGSAAIAALVTSAYYGRLVRPHRLGPLAASSRRRQ